MRRQENTCLVDFLKMLYRPVALHREISRQAPISIHRAFEGRCMPLCLCTKRYVDMHMKNCSVLRTFESPLPRREAPRTEIRSRAPKHSFVLRASDDDEHTSLPRKLEQRGVERIQKSFIRLRASLRRLSRLTGAPKRDGSIQAKGRTKFLSFFPHK